MVTNCQVFGERAGRFAGEYALGTGNRDLAQGALEDALATLRKFDGDAENAEDVLTALQQTTGENLMVTRNRQRLENLLGAVDALMTERLPSASAPNAAALRRAIEVENSLVTARLMARSALMRRESRGNHFREDYPDQDDNWMVNILLRHENGVLIQEKGKL